MSQSQPALASPSPRQEQGPRPDESGVPEAQERGTKGGSPDTWRGDILSFSKDPPEELRPLPWAPVQSPGMAEAQEGLGAPHGGLAAFGRPWLAGGRGWSPELRVGWEGRETRELPLKTQNCGGGRL